MDGLKNTLINARNAAQSMAKAVATPLEGIKGNIFDAKANIGTSAASMVGSTSVINNYNLTQNNTSPKSLTALETYQARREQIALVKAMT